jgi:hypothetical protein
MANYFANLPAYRVPDGPNFNPLNQAVQNFGETTRANAMAEYQAGQNRKAEGRANAAAGRASESFDMQKTEFRQQQQDRAHKALAATFQAIATSPAEQRAALYGQVRSSVKDFDNDVRAMGGNPDDMDSTMRLVTAQATGYQPAKGPDIREVNNSLVRVAPDGSSASPIYNGASPGMAGGFKDPKQQADVEEGMRKEFSALSKDFVTIRNAHSQIDKLATNGTAGSDVALIYSFMKILDPGSVVRETEYATAQNAAGVPDQIKNVWNRILDGERLNPNQRADFVNQAKTIYNVQEGNYRRTQEQYKGIAERKGLDPRNTMIEFASPDAMSERQAATQPGAQGQIPPGAVQMLRSNPSPEIVQQFEAKYGPGSAQQFLAR